ncbi:unnamed protein product [Nezara viridula]|uniref:Ig-like domain-containing protein n=1 Tax=Nezara viridula TaxID=85310 RepID=A0A9P0H1L0_NEZVI|nr:unnamed protein product [Nezara viridula]
MILLFQNNDGIWYGGNYISSCFKPKEEFEEFNRGILTSGNLLQSYRNLFRPFFRHKHKTLIKDPLVQQTGNVDFNYFNKHLSARENKFEHFPQYDSRIGKNHDSYYPTKFLLPNYKVLINPFSSRMNMPSKIGESQHFVNEIGDTLSNRRTIEPQMKLQGTGDTQYYCYGVKKRKPVHKKKKHDYDKLIYPHKAVGGLLLPTKIILDNLNSWKWKNKKEIQTNNLSMSMVYDLLSKSTTRYPLKKTDPVCHTTEKRKIGILEQLSEDQSVFPDRGMSPSNCFVSTERLMHLNKRTQINPSLHREETTNENDIERPEKFREYKKMNCLDDEMKNNIFPAGISDCGCRMMYRDQLKACGYFTTKLAITSEVPIIFKFEDYFCECYSCSSDSKRRKFHGRKDKRKKNKIKEKDNFLRNKDVETDLKINNGCDDLQVGRKHLINTDDYLNISKCIVISNDEVIDPNDEEFFNYDFDNITSTNMTSTDSSNMNEYSTEISRIKRRTFKSKSKWDRKRKRAFVPLNAYHEYLFRKPSAKLFSSPISSNSKNNNFKIRKVNKHKKKKIKHTIHKGLNLGISNREMTLKQKAKLIGDNVENEKDKVHKKREFVGERQSFNSSDLCEELQEDSTSMSTPSSPNSIKPTCLCLNLTHPSFVMTENEKVTHSTFVMTDTAKPIHSTLSSTDREKHHHFTFVNPYNIFSKVTGLISIHKSTHPGKHVIETSTKVLTIEMSTNIMPMFRPDTGNRHPAKLKCEQQYSRECVCSVTKALQEINNLISNNQEQKFLLNQLTIYNCTNYIPVEINYKMSPELKPRLISNKHKELLADEKNGPKEIIDETFQELLIRDVPNEVTDFYVFPSTNVEIPCFINDDIQLSPNTADSASYVWRQGDNKLITGGRVIEDLNHRGMLQIAEATLADSDNYTCTVNYTNPDTGQTVSDSFVHSVMVVTLPTFALHTLMHYSAKVKCDQETLEMFELYLPQQIEDYICYIEPDRKKICTVEIHNPICHPKSNENADLKSVWKFRSKGTRPSFASQENEENVMELSLNFELDIADVTQTMISAANKTRCGPFCQLKIILKVVDILRESFTIVLPHSVSSSAGAIFKPDMNSINMKILIACEGGFKLVQGFCMPCPANTYSEEGSTECSKCLSGTYQPNIGSRTCEKCPHPFRTGCSSLWLSPAVIAVTILIILLTVLISTILVYLCKTVLAKCMLPFISPCLMRCFRKKKQEKQIKQVKLEPTFPKKILKKKMRKLSPHRKKEDTTEPPTPPSEDFTS